MCDFCSKKITKADRNCINFKAEDFKNDSLSENMNLTISGNKLIIDYDAYSTDSSVYEKINIMYCMMCGRKL